MLAVVNGKVLMDVIKSVYSAYKNPKPVDIFEHEENWIASGGARTFSEYMTDMTT